MNTDEMVHIARAEYMSADSKEAESLLSDIMSRQNPDGGFGLTEEYESDVYDTVLALSAVCAQAVATPTITATRQETQHSTLRGNRKATEGMRTRMHLTAHRI